MKFTLSTLAAAAAAAAVLSFPTVIDAQPG